MLLSSSYSSSIVERLNTLLKLLRFQLLRCLLMLLHQWLLHSGTSFWTRVLQTWSRCCLENIPDNTNLLLCDLSSADPGGLGYLDVSVIVLSAARDSIV